jgi:hypothetical protein
MERYITAHLARDQDHKRSRLVREFISEFRGLSGSQKQKLVLEELDAARTGLAAFASNDGDIDQQAVARLLAAMQKHTRPPKARDLCVVGREHLVSRFTQYGVHSNTFQYKATIGDTEDGSPVVVEFAFGYFPEELASLRIVTLSTSRWRSAIRSGHSAEPAKDWKAS